MKKGITIRIRELIQVIKAVASGDFSARAKTTTKNDDFDALAVGINMMIEELSERFEQLKKARQEIEAGKKQLETYIESMGDGIGVTDIKGRLIKVNNAHVEMLGYDSADEILGRHPTEFLKKEEIPKINKAFKECFQKGSIKNFETINVKKDGAEFPIQLNVVLLKDSSGKAIGTIAVARDITERKEAESQIKASLEEKKTLLKEIHHRIKNNLQIVSSLLSLQSGYIKNEQVNEMLKESQNRLKLIALVHEKLYQSENLTRVDFAGYVRNLVAHLFYSYGVSSDFITLKMDMKDVLLNMDEAISCGLLINELVSNSLKHAFPKGRQGEIYIGFLLEKDERCILTIADNGIGFPQGLDFRRTKTLGFQLINTIVSQLEGSIELGRKQGTKFTITFKKRG